MSLPERPPHFFKFSPPHTAISVLETGKFRWSSPHIFCDIFDCSHSIAPQFDLQKFEADFCERFCDIILGDQEPSFDDSLEVSRVFRELRRLYRTPNLPNIRDRLRNLFREGVQGMATTAAKMEINWHEEMARIRIFCVCDTNDNELLWSNFAAENSGIAFQLECLPKYDTALLAARKVTYSDQPPLVTPEEWLLIMTVTAPEGFWQEKWYQLITTKAKRFEHESEWRVVSESRSGEPLQYSDAPFYPEEVSKIFFGPRIPHEKRARIMELRAIKYPHIQMFNAQPIRGTYKYHFAPV